MKKLFLDLLLDRNNPMTEKENIIFNLCFCVLMVLAVIALSFFF